MIEHYSTQDRGSPHARGLRSGWASQSGAMAIFLVVFALPVLFFLYSISVDVSVYFHQLQKIQKIVDDAALYSYRFLPYKEAANSAACAFVGQYDLGDGALACGEQIEVSIPSDASSISVTARTTSQLTFASYFGVEAALPLEAFAVARGTPYDVFIAMDTSSYLAPPVLTGPAWNMAGGASSPWPAATFFNTYPLQNNGVQVDPVLLTQQCTNPAFNVIKAGAIQSYEYLASNGINAVGLAVYPGSFNDVEVLRPVLPRQGSSDQITYTPYERIFNSNTFCMAAAENDSAGSPNAFPVANAKFGWSGEDDPLRPSPIVLPGSWQLNPEYPPYFRAREVLWGQAAREDAYGDIGALLSSVRANLVGSVYVGARGGMANNAIKSAIIFAGDLPRSAGNSFAQNDYVKSLIKNHLAALRADLAANHFKMVLYYVLLEHGSVSGGSFDEGKLALEELFAQESVLDGENGSSLELRLLSGNDGQALVDEVVGSLLLDKRRVVLGK